MTSCPPPARGNAWERWHSTSRCHHRALCIPVTSTTGVCSCEYSYEMWADKDYGSACEVSTSSKIYAAFWLVMCAVALWVTARTIRTMRRAALNKDFRVDFVGITTCLCLLASSTHALSDLLKACVILSNDEAFETLQVAFRAVQSITILCVIAALLLLGASVLLFIVKSKRLARTSRLDIRKIQIFTITASIVNFGIVIAGALTGQLGVEGAATGFSLLLSWCMIRAAVYYSPKEHDSSHVSGTSAQQYLIVLLGEISKVGWPALASFIVATVYCVIFFVGRKHVNRGFLSTGMAVLVYSAFFAGIAVTKQISDALAAMFDIRKKWKETANASGQSSMSRSLKDSRNTPMEMETSVGGTRKAAERASVTQPEGEKELDKDALILGSEAAMSATVTDEAGHDLEDNREEDLEDIEVTSFS